LTEVGTSIQPPEDIITVYTDTFLIETSTVRLDSIFAKSSNCLLGEMYDPLYGYMKADFLCQFYCEDGFQFSKTPYNGRVDSIALAIFYADSAWYGDPLSPMEVSVFPIDRPLKKNFYTSDDARNYCDMNRPLGVQSYTPYEMDVPDSIRNYQDVYSGNRTYVPSIRIRLPHEMGQRFYDETLRNPASFASQEAFNEFFPGIYVTNTHGSGNLISTNTGFVEMYIYYSYVVEGSQGQDSIVNHGEIFAISKEVIQINRFEHSQIERLVENNPSRAYITSPAGVCTKLVVPTTRIAERMDVTDRLINGFSLNLKYLPEDEWEYAYSPPNYLLLVPEDSVITFFEKGYVDDNKSFFISYMHDANRGYTSSSTTYYGYNPSTRTYSFGNISALIKSHIQASPDEDLRLLAIPVNREYGTYSYSYYYSTNVSHTFILSGVKIRTDDDYMKAVLLSSKFEMND
jgi:hypothetical protein